MHIIFSLSILLFASQTIEMGVSSNTFMYFAYGSNLLTKRIHIQNPTAVRKAIGKLSNYRLDFNRYSKRWAGASATIVPELPEAERHVWGAIWEINESNKADLDRQEGVHENFYLPLTVGIETSDGVINCRVYQQVEQPPAILSNETLPEERKPSLIYKTTIIQGAIESGLPEDYVEFLKAIPDNGKMGEAQISLELGLTL